MRFVYCKILWVNDHHKHERRKDIQSYPIRPDEVNDWNCASP